MDDDVAHTRDSLPSPRRRDSLSLSVGQFLSGVVKAPDGALLVVDTENNCIRRLHDGARTVLAGSSDGEAGVADGVGDAARFHSPRRASGLKASSSSCAACCSRVPCPMPVSLDYQWTMMAW